VPPDARSALLINPKETIMIYIAKTVERWLIKNWVHFFKMLKK
jgi:hypothetical protein